MNRAWRQVILMSAMVHVVMAQEPSARASLATKGDMWVGQRITIAVELLAPGYFASAPSFELPNTPGMLIIPPVGSPIVSSELNNGVDFTVQRHELSVVGHRTGSQEIPSVTVRFRFKRQPLDKDSVPATVKTGPLTFVLKAPPGAEKFNNVISARELAVVEEWKPDTKQAKVGDTLVRTITYTAPDVPSMLFPPFPAAEIDGLGVYRKSPEVMDESNRGQVQGKRRDVISYVCKRVGAFAIPSTRLTWWDMDAKQLRAIEFPERVLQVAPNPAMAGGGATSVPLHRFSARVVLEVGAVLAGAAVGLWAIWRKRNQWMRPFRAVHLVPLNPSQGNQKGH